MSELKQIGQLVRARTLDLQRTSADLVGRGLEDLSRLQLDPRLEKLIGQLKGPAEWTERVEAWHQLREMGPAVPGWCETLRDLIDGAEDGWARIFAAEALAWHACSPNETIPVLVATVDASLNLRQFEWARMACGAIGKYANIVQPLNLLSLPVLLRALGAEDHNVRGYAALALGNLGKVSRTALVKIANLLDRSEGALSEAYLAALRKIEPDIDSPMDAWVYALDHTDPAMRADAVSCIGRKGSGATEAVPDLLRMSWDQSAQVRKVVALALARIGVASESALVRLVHLSGDSDPSVRLAAEYALFKLGAEPGKHIRKLREGLKSPEPNTRFLAGWALGRTGSYGRLVTRLALGKALRRETEPLVRDTLHQALAKLKTTTAD